MIGPWISLVEGTPYLIRGRVDDTNGHCTTEVSEEGRILNAREAERVMACIETSWVTKH